MHNTKALREEFATLHTACAALLALCATEKRQIKPEEAQENDRRYARMDEIKATLKAQARLASYALSKDEAELPNQGDPGRQPEDAPEIDVEKYKKAVNHYCRTGEVNRELFAAAGCRENFTGIISTTQSGIMIPTAVAAPVEVRRLTNVWRRLLAFMGMPVIKRDRTEGVDVPVFDDTANIGEAVTEDASSGTLVDPALTGSISLAPTLYGSKQLWFSNTVALANDFDVFTYANPILEKRLNLKQNSDWSAEVIANATVGKTLAATGAITYAEFLDFEHSLAPAYRMDGAFVFADSLYKLMRGLLDDNNRPLIELNLQTDWLEEIHGKPVLIDDYMEAVAANKKVGAFVSAESVKILDAGPRRIARYTLVPARPDQTGFEMFQNGDFGFVSNGIRTLKTAVS